MIPEDFRERMSRMLSEEEYEAFMNSYEQEKEKSLRVNTLKGSVQEFAALSPFSLESVPWVEQGFYYPLEQTPGKHPYHEAGVYYIQEASAMAPAAYLDARPGERVLDLCAAPGGKSTQIAAAMQGEGLLVSNEIHPARAKILSENVERMGIRNCLVVNETPQSLRKHFDCFFHRIMVDAPCSGEGLFRKQEDAYQEWSLDNVKMCGQRQDEILEEAYHMLLPGGRMVYSTCTFAPEENEGSISRLIACHPDMKLVQVQKYEGMADGVSQWYEAFASHTNEYTGVEDAPVAEGIERTIRLWPHKLRGEGHFVAVLQKDGPDILDENAREELDEAYAYRMEKTEGYKKFKELQAFAKETLVDDTDLQQGDFLSFGDQVYLVPQGLPSLKGLKVLRPGLHLGTMKKNRFEPSHAWALALKPEEVKHLCNLDVNDARVQAYLRGETISWEGEKGWYLLGVLDINGQEQKKMPQSYSFAWGKLVGNTMKNHYPKGLRG